MPAKKHSFRPLSGGDQLEIRSNGGILARNPLGPSYDAESVLRTDQPGPATLVEVEAL